MLTLIYLQKRMLFAGITAAKKTVIQNWCTPHMCGKTYWVHSLLKIVTCVQQHKLITIDAWQHFSSTLLIYIKEWLYNVTLVFI